MSEGPGPVKRFGFPPDKSRKKMLLALCGERESNAIHLPSGDQLGLPAVNPPALSAVICRTFEPSLAQIQMFDCPERVEANAIRAPSGENTGVAFAGDVFVS